MKNPYKEYDFIPEVTAAVRGNILDGVCAMLEEHGIDCNFEHGDDLIASINTSLTTWNKEREDGAAAKEKMEEFDTFLREAEHHRTCCGDDTSYMRGLIDGLTYVSDEFGMDDPLQRRKMGIFT